MSVEDEKHKIDGDIQTITTIPSTQYVSGVREIDERCYTKWRIESTEIARGYGAVIYQTSGGKVARVTQFNVDEQQEKKKFLRDVHVRSYLQTACPDLSITKVDDAFICNDLGVGVTITDRCENNIMEYMLNLRRCKQMLFLEFLKTALPTLVKQMHGCGVFHRDLHPGNVLVKGNRIVLTDFEEASGEAFGATDRLQSAYFANDMTSVVTILEELRAILDYISGRTTKIDPLILEESGVDYERLTNLREKNATTRAA